MSELNKIDKQKRVELLSNLDTVKTKYLKAGVSEEAYRDLIFSRADEPDFIQTHIWMEIAEQAKKREIGRQLVDMIKPKDNIVQIDIDPDEGATAPTVSPGGEIPMKTELVSTANITCFKIGTRPVITQEMIEDSLFPAVGRQLRFAGRRIALREDLIIMRQVRYNSAETTYTVADSSLTNNVDTAGTFTDNNWSSCIDKIETDGFEPDVTALHTNLMADVRTETAFATNAGWQKGTSKLMNTGLLGGLWNMNVIVTNHGLSSTADHVAGMVMDKSAGVRFALRRDTTVKNYEDPIRDLVGIAVTKRLNAAIINEDSMCSIQR